MLATVFLTSLILIIKKIRVQKDKITAPNSPNDHKLEESLDSNDCKKRLRFADELEQSEEGEEVLR